MMMNILNKETKFPKYIKIFISTVMLAILFLISVVMKKPDDPKTIKVFVTTVSSHLVNNVVEVILKLINKMKHNMNIII